MGCPGIFGKDPERYLKAQGVGFDCPVKPGHRARIEPEFRAYVNHEVFYFCDADALARFRKDPTRYCGLVTDPVSKARFHPTSRSPRFDYRGRPYFFVDRLTFRTFVAIPDSFAFRKGA
jgi:YHS domain-containing protein